MPINAQVIANNLMLSLQTILKRDRQLTSNSFNLLASVSAMLDVHCDLQPEQGSAEQLQEYPYTLLWSVGRFFGKGNVVHVFQPHEPEINKIRVSVFDTQ